MQTRPFFVAEISANHLGSKKRAHQLVEFAAQAGASAIKLQTYTPEGMTLNLDEFSVSQQHELWGGYSLFQLYREAMTPWEWHADIFEHARELKLVPFSSPFDVSAVDFLEELNCPIYKIASLETSDVDLISYAASKNKQMIISTGASTLSEIEEAVKAASPIRNKLTLLVCTSSYPAIPSDAHVARISTLKNHFNTEVGISDHTLGIGVSLAAIALGATVVEKHLTINRKEGGHDSAFSLEPEEFRQLVEEGNKTFDSIGNSNWSIQESEQESRNLRRSLYISKSVKKGDIATRENVKALRPNKGGPISSINEILGKAFNRDFAAGHPATPECVD